MEGKSHRRRVHLDDVIDLRLSSVDKQTKANEHAVRLCNYMDVYNNSFIHAGIDFMTATATEREIEKCTLVAGDVIITKDSEKYDDIGVPALIRENVSDLICGYHLAILRPRLTEVDGTYLFYALSADDAQQQFHRYANGVTRFGLRKADIGLVEIPIPPLPEQRAIAAVLDSINGAIERTEAVITASVQLRDSLLHELLMRGVPGWHTEWKEAPGVGTIPACWEVVRLGEVAEVRNGTTPSRARLDYWQVDEVPFVKTGQVNDVFIVEPDEFITSQAVTAGAVVVPKGSVLIAMIGQGKTRGMTARLGFDAAINQNFAAVYGADEDFSLEFFFAWARHNYSVIRALGQGSNQDALNCALIEGMRSPKPPVAEQRAITAMLDSIDEAIKQTRNEREELQSLKASAADALLTGRVRVPTGKVRTNA